MMTTPQEWWDAEAASFDEPADHSLRDPAVRRAWRELLAELLPDPPGRIADLGCGTGTLSLLMAEMGFAVDGLDFSAAMLGLAEAKLGGHRDVTFTLGDAADPPFTPGTYDAVLCRHVLWALPDPADGLSRWSELLAPGGRLVLVEGLWGNGAGMAASEVTALLEAMGREATLRRLDDPGLWGREISDDRYVVLSPPH